jgi:hypothetical protein
VPSPYRKTVRCLKKFVLSGNSSIFVSGNEIKIKTKMELSLDLTKYQEGKIPVHIFNDAELDLNDVFNF